MIETIYESSAGPATYGEGTVHDPAGSGPDAGLLGGLEGADDPAVRRVARLAVGVFASQLQARLMAHAQRADERGLHDIAHARRVVATVTIPELLGELEVEQRTVRALERVAPEDAPAGGPYNSAAWPPKS